jgi:predicted transcriptional regulator YdeE
MNEIARIINFNELDLIGIKTELTKSQNENYFLIRNLWKQFNLELKNIKNRTSGNWEKFGITFRENGHIFYMASIEIASKASIPQNMITTKIKQGSYLRFVHIGNMYDIKKTVYNIYKKIIPTYKFEIGSNEKEGLVHFERYDYRFKWNNPESLLEIYLPVNTYEH